MMNTVIGRLSEIETTANRIIDNANSQKEVLSKEMEQKIVLFDKESEQSTALRLASMRESMNIEIKKQSEKLQADADEALNALEQDYQNNHTEFAKNILFKLTGA